MNTTTIRRLPAAALATAIVGASAMIGSGAGAAEVTVTASATIPVTDTDWTDSVTLPKFDATLGELRTIDLRVEAHLEGTAAVENTSAGSAVLVSTLAALVTVNRPAPGASLVSVEPNKARSDSLDPYDGLIDHDGASGAVHDVNDDRTTTVSLTAPADLALFTGTGSITLPTSGVDTSVDPAGPDVHAELSTKVGARVTVTYTYVTDTRPPDAPTIDAAPGASTSDPDPIVTFTAEAGATTECRLDRGAATGSWGGCTSPWQGHLAVGPDGAFTFLVRATDAAGNVGDPAQVSFTLDRQAPSAPVFTTSPPALGRLPHPTWAFTVEVGAVARCSLDGAAPVACSSPYVADLTTAPDGSHTLSVVAVDAAGNTSPATSGTFVLDRVAPLPPTLTATPPSPGNDPTPTWSFDLAADAVAASCSVDGAPFSSCMSPFTANLAMAGDGDHTVAIRDRDAARNMSTEATVTYRLDRAAPGAPTIVGPASPSSVVDPSWSIGTEAGATTECRLDAGSWSACAGSFTTTFGPGSDGVHLLTVRATDTAGNQGSEATSAYVLDTTAPGAPVITTAPANPSNSPNPTWTFTIEGGSAATCSVDGGPWTACTSPLLVDLSEAPDGRHSLAVRATDPQANVGPATTSAFVLDRTAPGAPTITESPASPGSSATVTWAFGTPEGTTTTCRIDMGEVHPCSGSITTTFTSDGLHRLAIVARDVAGNRSAVAVAMYLLDRVAPVPPTINSAPITPARLTTPQWTFTLEAQTIGQCSLDGLPWVPCTTSYSADLSSAGDGTHTLAVRSTDAAGNVGDPATGEFVLDRTPPEAPVITDGPRADSDDDTPTWTFTIESGAAAECRVDDGPWLPCADSLTADLIGSADGTHSIEVRAIDHVGNVGPNAVAAFGLDRVQPAAAVFTATPLSPGNDPDPEWSFTYEPGTLAVCALDGAEAAVCDDTFAASMLADGDHTLVVQITDAAGNASEVATSTYALDTWSPVAPIVSAPTTPDRDVQPEWTFELEEGAVAECTLDDGEPEACGTMFSIDLTGRDGPHSLVVVARDAAGNTSEPVASTYVLDTVAPSAPVLRHTPDRSEWTWRFSIEPQTTAECSLDSGPWARCASPTAGGVPDRTVRFEVRAVDRAGNRSDITGTTVTPTRSTGVVPPPPSNAPTTPPRSRPPATEGGNPTPPPTSTRTVFGLHPAGRFITPDPGVETDPLRSSLVRRFQPSEPFGGPVAQLLQAVGEKTTIPVLVVLLVIGFVAVQNRIDRRDPKLAQAPLRHEPEYMEFK